MKNPEITFIVYYFNFFISAPPHYQAPHFSKLCQTDVNFEFSDLENLRLGTHIELKSVLIISLLYWRHNFRLRGELISKLNSATSNTQHLMSRINFCSYRRSKRNTTKDPPQTTKTYKYYFIIRVSDGGGGYLDESPRR